MIAVTTDAQDKITEVLARHPAAHRVRVSVVRGPHGCVHGWTLGMEQSAQPDDMIYTAGQVEVVVEPALVDELDGATIDYREEGTAIGFRIDLRPNRDREHHSYCDH